MRKCRNCLCRTCTNVCCDKRVCPGKKKECERYSGFRQMDIFDTPEPEKCKAAPRYPWRHYGLDDKKYRIRLREMAESGKYADCVRRAAYRTDTDIAKYIIKAVVKKKSWDYLENDLELGRICVGRSNFYGYVRKFYYFFEEELKEKQIKI